MSDDWEAELEAAEKMENEKKEDSKKPVEVESEVIIKPKVEYTEKKQEPKEDPNDDERKYLEKEEVKARLERQKIEQEAFKDLDEKSREKVIQEKRKLEGAADFLGVDKKKEEVSIVLTTEKDFIDLAVNSVSRIKAAGKPSKFTFSYLKNNLDLLGPTLEAEKIDQLIKDLTVLFNKKRKEESDKGGKKPGKAKPTINATKGIDKLDKAGLIEDYGGKAEDLYEDNDYLEDDFI